MSDLLDLANAYFIVARDLEARAYDLNKMGRSLFEIADHLCEQNIKNTEMEPVPENSASTGETPVT